MTALMEPRAPRLAARLTLALVVACGAPAHAAEGPADTNLSDVLPEAEWRRVEASLDRALDWLATQQSPDGSFPSPATGQPAVTSLAVLALLSCGARPGVGPAGAQIDRAIDYTLDCQQPSGLIAVGQVQTMHVHQGVSHTASYNHAIAGLMLGEVYGQVDDPCRADRVHRALLRALGVTARLQVAPAKRNPADQGGWRYLRDAGINGSPSMSDLSATAWHLMFLRSAKNAEFDVPAAMIDQSVAYIQRCHDPVTGAFRYGINGPDAYVSRGVTGAGVLSLALAGRHGAPMASRAGDWILQRPFTRYHETFGNNKDRFLYSAYYCSNAMAQLGGRHWEGCFPTLARTLLDAQEANGSWARESGEDGMYGPVYATSLAVLALTPAHQLLPIYQR